MSEALVLVFSPELPSVEAVRDAISLVGRNYDASGGISVTDNEQTVYLIWSPGDESGRDEVFEGWPVDLIPRDSHFIGAHYKWDQTLVRRVVLALAEKFTFLIDTNFGETYSSAAFVSRCKLEPAWDWHESEFHDSDENAVYLDTPNRGTAASGTRKACARLR